MLIVEKGQPKAIIVVGANPSVVEQFAAEELSEYISRMTGVPLPVDAAPQPGPSIRVGREPAVATLGATRFANWSKPHGGGRIAFSGRDIYLPNHRPLRRARNAAPE